MYNHIIIDGDVYMMEMNWRKNKNDMTKDSKGKRFPYPREGTEWDDMKLFINRMKEIENILDRMNSYKKIENKNCLLCGKKNISTKMYLHNRILWENGLIHYIEMHSIEPSKTFKNMIYLYEIEKKKNNHITLNGKYEGNYVRIDKRQLNILDALMIHGGYNKKYTTENEAKYSEHAGVLDFEGTILTKIIVSSNFSRIDDDDDDIYLPVDLDNMKEYEYIFHSHPPTPKPGGRAINGILYEFPSMGDIFHFIDYHNKGNIVGSLVITSEGLYCIRKSNDDSTNISIDDDALFKAYHNAFYIIQEECIDMYGTKFSTRRFYNKIAQDTQWIDKFNKILNKYDIHIDYHPRKKDINNEWILDTVFLPFRKNKKKK